MSKNKFIIGIIGLLVLAAPAWTQERPFDFYQTSPLTFSAGVDSGVALGNHKISGTALFLSAPTFSMMRTAPRNDFSLFYQPEFEMFPSYHSLDSWDHSGGLKWNYNLSSRW